MYGLECEYAFDSAHFLTDYYNPSFKPKEP